VCTKAFDFFNGKVVKLLEIYNLLSFAICEKHKLKKETNSILKSRVIFFSDFYVF
jgi:hypothetical protein